jgi:ATP-dependent DNA helicase RecG
MLTLQTPVAQLGDHRIPRVGSTTAQKLAVALAAAGNKPDTNQVTVEDLLYYLPMRYEDRSNLATINQLVPGQYASVEVRVRVSGNYFVKGGRLTIFELSATDQTGQIRAYWWNQRWLEETLKQGTRVILYGQWQWNQHKHCLETENPEFEVLSEQDDTEPIHTGRRVPIYRKLGNFRTRQLRSLIYQVVNRLSAEAVPESLPTQTLARYQWMSRYEALVNVHFPADETPMDDYNWGRAPAMRRLIFEEFFWLQLALALRRQQRERAPKGTVVHVDDRVRDIVRAILPFSLTTAQRRVLKEIIDNLTSTSPMNRLLQGDVGSGKTIVALLAMVVVVESGYQTALMAPTEILAEQHNRNLKRILARTPYRVELLTGSIKGRQKRALYQAIAEGEVDLVIGTHALIQDEVRFQKLGLVVIDEQHRFGVMQRAELIRRGYNPDVLVMTATPIPRSLAMTVYGDLDGSVIDELPPGRTPVKTVLRFEDARQNIYRFMAEEIRAGRQVYIVYPLVEESEKMDLLNATQMAEHLQTVVFPKFRVGLLHGKMKPAEKDEVMRRFVAGELHILVSTTVIEVGVDVPNASIMVIEHAERFGLAQLHQMRGRVGRGAAKSYCILMSKENASEDARQRLGIMVETTDGFKIAEKDLELRGPGELMGTKQSGVPVCRVGNIVRDQRLLMEARREVERLTAARPRSPELARLVEQIKRQPKYGLATVG